ncbi:MAG: hypothetical protein LAQ69_33225 [Acidobacteriia bacterium]|nr:hypothetical protein [Terriglobia bacterium]
MKDCTVCLVEHDDEIHAATLSVRSWFHQQVVQGFYDEPSDEAPILEPDPLATVVPSPACSPLPGAA